MKLKITQRGFETYTGMIAEIAFDNGVSVEHVSRMDAKRLASIMSMEDLETGKNPSWTQELVDNRTAVLMPNGQLSTAGMSGTDVAVKSEREKAVEKAEAAAELTYDFTQEKLEEIADKGGIAELRKFAASYDVRGGSIGAIIASMMAKKSEAEKKAK